MSSEHDDSVILEDFGPKVSFKSSVLFVINALIVSSTPIFLFWRIHHVSLQDYAPIFAFGTAIASGLMFYAYRNTKFLVKHDIAQSREDAVRKEMNNELANDKKMSRKEKDERILWKKNQVADTESTSWSIFFNNLLFLVTVLVFSALLRSYSPSVNYTLSTALSAGLAALLASGSKSAF